MREPPSVPGQTETTADAWYTERLVSKAERSWKQRLDVQRPYRWNLRRLNLGRTLDVGCGIGRNLAHLDGNAVGVDHNPTSVATARARGLTAFTPKEFEATGYQAPGAFDSMLMAHVVEHMPGEEALALVREYLPLVRPGGRAVFICPQERGWASDETHVRFVDLGDLAQLSHQLGMQVERAYSFPFPRWAGRWFTYNEFVLVARTPGAATTYPPRP